MKAFLIQLFVQLKMDLRDKGTLMVYYLVPLVFYLVMGSIMKAIGLDAQTPIILAITIFALSMSAFLFTGIMFPAELLPLPMQWLGLALPAGQGVLLLNGATLAPGPLAILCGVTLVSFAVSAILFRRISMRK